MTSSTLRSMPVVNPSEPQLQQPRQADHGRRSLVLIAVASVLSALLTVGAQSLLPKAPTLTPGQLFGPLTSSAIVLKETPNVLVAVRDLQRLESAQAHYERVVDLKNKQTSLFGMIEAEDSLLLVASGDVTAGVDLSQLREQDITVDPETSSVQISLPAARIFASRIDNQRTYLHSRKTDLLARRDETLETKARSVAEEEIMRAAKESGLEERANESAKKTIQTLVRSLGFANIAINVRPGT